MTEKPVWQCVTPGCRRAKLKGDWCGTCERENKKRPLVVRTAKPDIRTTVYPTGETRTAEGQHQTQMTDGRQTWWAVREEWAA